MTIIRNPVLPGFNPDPAFCRLGDDYYIATSTFEWYPGVQIHHSRDLVNWRLVCRPLNRKSQLDMRGDPDSCGVWAPALTYSDGSVLAHLHRREAASRQLQGHAQLPGDRTLHRRPLVDPVYVNSSGFDPSLFHDDDSRKWFLNMVWDHRRRRSSFDGILLQEYSPAEERLVGPIKNIFKGSPLGLVEGPHLSKRNGWYYLTVAEGGTGYNHAVTMARSRSIDGPYELHPDIHIITSKDAPDAPLQRAGHGFYVETPAGEVFHTHLCSRPLPGTKRSPLGRETALQRMVWRDDDWLYLAQGGQVPAVEVEGPDLPPHPFPDERERHDFDGSNFLLYSSGCERRNGNASSRSRRTRAISGSMDGNPSEAGSSRRWSPVARRPGAMRPKRHVISSRKPTSQLAGLICYYDRARFHYLAVSADDDGKRVLQVISCLGDQPDALMTFAL